MKPIFGRRPIRIATILISLLAGYAGTANAQAPTKDIKIYNNSTTDTIYPVLWAFIGNVDLWLQAQFGVSLQMQGHKRFVITAQLC
jgi:hypothetical protein